jgi:hypothetical protein
MGETVRVSPLSSIRSNSNHNRNTYSEKENWFITVISSPLYVAPHRGQVSTRNHTRVARTRTSPNVTIIDQLIAE